MPFRTVGVILDLGNTGPVILPSTDVYGVAELELAAHPGAGSSAGTLPATKIRSPEFLSWNKLEIKFKS